MLRRLPGFCLALSLLLLSFPSSVLQQTYAQDGSPVAVDPVDDLEDAASAPESVAPADDLGNTPAGISSNIPVFALTPDVYLYFNRVTGSGNTVASEYGIAAFPALPAGFRLDNARAFTISTTASFEPALTVCIFSGAGWFADPSSTELFLLVGADWVTITGYRDPSSGTVCGYSNMFGTFAVAEFGAPPTAAPTDTTVQSPTATTVPSQTPTTAPTETPTASATNTLPASQTPSPTPSPTPSETASVTATVTPTPIPSDTPSFTATPTSATGKTQFAMPNVWVTFSQPPSSGTTSGAIVDGNSLPALPATYSTASGWYFTIQTSVINGDNKELCVLFDTAPFIAPGSVSILRLSGSSWIKLTGLHLTNLFSDQGTICGYTASFGTFALVEPVPPTATATPSATRTLTPSHTPSNTPTASNTATASATSTATATTTNTSIPTASNTATRTTVPPNTATSIAAATPSPIPSGTASPTATKTIAPPSSPTIPPTSTISPTPTPSSTATSTNTSTPSSTSTSTLTPTLAPGSYSSGTTLRTTTKVNLRSGPSATSATLGVVASGTTIMVTGPSTVAGGRTWVPVNASALGNGWIAGDYLITIPTPTPARTAAPATITRSAGASTSTRTPTRPAGGFIAGDFVRTTASVNLRSGASASSQVLSVLPAKTVGQVTGPGVTSGSTTFYPVLFDGRPAGYVASGYLQRITSTPTATRTPSPSPTVVGVPLRWTTSDVNMRSGAGSGYRVVSRLPQGTRVNIIGTPKRNGGYDWYPVAVYGIGNGWIADKFLSTTPPL